MTGSLPTPLRERLGRNVQVDPTRGCWLWTGYIKPNGYASIYDNRAKEKRYVHRLSYELFIGPIPEGLQIDHLCKVRHCINPEHLEAVTARENLMRSENFTAREAHAVTCKFGHLYDEANTRWWHGHRICRACHAKRARQYRKEGRA